MNSLYLKSARLILEPLKEQHADFLLEGLQDRQLYQFIPQEPPADDMHLRERFMRLAKGPSPYGNEIWLNWAVREKFGEHYVGLIEATVDDNFGVDKSAHIAYFIFRPFWRSGYATEACGRAIEHLIHDRDCKVVRAEVDTRNAASIALLEKLGFQRIAFNTEADVFKGASSDEYVYELRA
jgi:[ribosomal protein S5]-alanine N-acetyltransferase